MHAVGTTPGTRIERIRGILKERGLDAFLVTAMPDIRWACGFTGSDGLLLIDASSATLLTDGRYRDQAPIEVAVANVAIYPSSATSWLKESEILPDYWRIGVDSSHVTLDFVETLQSDLPGLEFCPVASPFVEFIAAKDSGEIEALRRAQAVTDAVFDELLSLLRPGLSELDIASEIVYRHLQKGASAMSFEPIVASGPNGALPHARPSTRKIQDGDLVVLDFGCFVDGYASDMTRTVAIGVPDPEAAKAYDVVLSAQSEAERHARSGMVGHELDRIGRTVIEDAGYGASFTHSLGHGLGLRIHEWPRIGRSSNHEIPENAVITIEPGVYIPDSFGIRVENAVLVSSSDSQPLPKVSKELIVI